MWIARWIAADGSVTNLSDGVSWIWTGHDGFGVDSLEHLAIQTPGTNGDYWLGLRQPERIVSLDLQPMADSEAAYEARRAQLLSLLTRPGTLEIVLEDMSAWRLDCVLAGSLGMGRSSRGAYLPELAVDLRSRGLPYWYAATPTSVTVPAVAGVYLPIQLPAQLPQSGIYATYAANNPGHVPTPVEIVLTGPASGPRFINTTTGRTIGLNNLVLTAGSRLVLNTHPHSRRVQVDNVDRWDFLTETSFWPLAEGLNSIMLDVGGTGPGTTLTLLWYERRRGI